MYLHRLELRAIGPYADTVTIDFAALAASGVFLLEGPTGSGKSTIIDAVVFALYGKQSGSESSDDRLHSQHADPAVEPFVELVFETGAGLYRVRRTPQYDRPKQRGSGTVRQQASAQLYRLATPTDVPGEPVSSRIPEIGLEITRAVGLDRAQFLQTVVLPQGEFARFLRSPGEDRRKLLQSLFGTAVYDRTAEELAVRRRAVQAEVESADAAVRDALTRFAQAAGVDDPDESTAADTAATLRDAATAAAQARRAAAAAADTAEQTEQDAVARTRAAERRAGLLQRAAALDARAESVDDARRRLGLDDRAARVAAIADGLDTARARADAAAARADALRSEHGVTTAAAPLRADRDRLTTAVATVRPLVDLAAGLDARRRAVDAALADAAALDERVTLLSAQLEARPAERAQIVEAARAAAAAAATGTAAQHDLDRALALRDDLAARSAVADRVTAAQTDVDRLRTVARTALHTEQRLRERRIAGLAGELGAALTPGAPCPVCGAADHPAVAQPQDDHPSAEAVDAAAAATRAADQDLAAAAADLAVERAELERLTGLLAGRTAEDVERLRADAASRVRAAHDAADAVRDLEQRRQTHDDATRALERERNDVDTRRAVLRSTAAAETERLDTDAAQVQAALRAAAEHLDPCPDTLGAAVHALAARAALLTQVVDADDRSAAAADDLAARAAETGRALAEHGFPDVSAARAAALAPDERDRLQQAVADAERERAVVDAGLAEPAVVAAADDDAAGLDVDAARAERARAVAALDDVTRRATTAADRADAAERCLVDLVRAVRARDDRSARSRAIVRLADVAAGVTAVNPSGITLGTYVLMRRFEDVVAAANDRLRGMLAGRFTLETSDERESGSRARRTGLALAVHDHTTDTVRDPRSLSGGETFTVSLCLALGLADVVQAEAGGVSLGTLFVDEGFGTLDPETLDDVIGQLSRLTAGGRQVGIVSHVEELKQRIPERIEVRRTGSGGSRVTTTV